MQWYFNHLRASHAMSVDKQALMAMGTTANEAYHSEINFRNQSEIYSTTVQLQLSIANMGKQLTHNSAMYSWDPSR